MLPDTYPSRAAVAKEHKVSAPAVTGWAKHAKWPCKTGKLDKAKVDEFVAKWIVPHRRGGAKKPVLTAPTQPDPVPSPTPPQPLQAVAPAPTPESIPRTLEELERAIKLAKDDAEAGLLATQVRALKGLQDIMERQRDLMPLSEVKRHCVAVLGILKTRLLEQPSRLASAMVGLGEEEIRAVWYGENIKLLGELSRSRLV